MQYVVILPLLVHLVMFLGDVAWGLEVEFGGGGHLGLAVGDDAPEFVLDDLDYPEDRGVFYLAAFVATKDA